MKILFVALSENLTVRGVERYSLCLLDALLKFPDLEITIVCGSWQKYFNDYTSGKISTLRYPWPNNKFLRHAWLAFFLPAQFRKYDVIHFCNTAPILFNMHRNCIATVHDLAEYFYPQRYSKLQVYYRRFISFLSVRNSTAVITDSKYSADTIKHIFRSKTPIFTVYLGSEHIIKNQQISDCSPEESNYLFCWSPIDVGKGSLESIKGFSEYAKKYPGENINLVIAGKSGSAMAQVKGLVSENIHYIGEITDDLLIRYLRNAKAVLFLSKYEGFGFPSIEAFVHNNNVIASKTTSVGEISVPFAFLVDPEDPNEICNAIHNALYNPRFFSPEARSNILRNYSWDVCALQTQDAYLYVSNKNY